MRSRRNRRKEYAQPKRRRNALHLERLEPRHVLSAVPLITEFLASNDNTLDDEDGESSDWIEIYNAGDESLDLDGWHLTDDAADLTQWTFPAVTLNAGQYLVVFASSKDRADADGTELHTNFNLGSSGEYLGLIEPDGVTVASDYAPTYPQQSTDISFGQAFNTSFTRVVESGSEATYWIPTDNTVDTTWTANSFDDSAWQIGVASLGYEESPSIYNSLIQTVLPIGTQSVYVRIPFTVADAASNIGELRMKFDDGFVAYLNGTLIATANAPDTVDFESEATEFHAKEAAIEDGEFNVANFSNLLQVGENVLAIHLMDATSSPSNDLLLSPTLALAVGTPVSPSNVGALISPTPGVPNSNLLAGGVSFSRAGGAFDSSFPLTLTPAVAGESIRYTDDGGIPQSDSLLYTGSITVSSTTGIRARAFGSEGQVGSVHSETFTLATSTVASFTSNLPIVLLETLGQGVPFNKTFRDGTLSLYETDEVTGLSSLAEAPDITSRIGYHRRGSSTVNQAKPNLRIEFRDEAGRDKEVELLDMPADSDWILHAPYTTDRSMLRNTVLFDLSGQMGGYAIRTRYVEVYLNGSNGILGENDYMGVYVLMENVKRGEQRVDIDKLISGDVTGGYILKIGRSAGGEDDSWSTQRGTPSPTVRIVHIEPKRHEMTGEQVDYIRNYIDDFENALNGANSTDPFLGYASYINVDSWIDHHLLRVFSKETDVVVFSEHFFKPSGGRLTFGPVWDFDRAAGSEGTANGVVEGFKANSADPFQYGWWDELFDDLNFRQKWADRWQVLRATVFSDVNLEATVLSYANQLDEAQPRNAARWPAATPNGGIYAESGLTGWDAEVSHFVGWLTGRAAWFDGRMVDPPAMSITPGNTTATGVLALTPNQSGSDIYYTLDGSDPRASGGAVSGNALLYTEPITLSETTQIVARSFADSGYFSRSRMVTGSFHTNASADATNLRVTELHYNPADPSASELTAGFLDNDDFEFVELLNTSAEPIELQSVVLSEGTNFTFNNSTTLAPGERVVLVENQAAFEERYGTTPRIVGQWTGRLGNGGETITISDLAGSTIQSFTYQDGDDPGEEAWPTAPDGNGPSLVVIDTQGDYDDGTNWEASSTTGGTPGADNAPPIPGDYNADGTVDQLDYTVWKSTFGSTTDLRADGNGDLVVSAADYTVWRDHLGQTAPASVAAPITILAATTQSATAPLEAAWPLEIGADDSPASQAFASFDLGGSTELIQPVAFRLAARETGERLTLVDVALREIAEEEAGDLCEFDADCLEESAI